MILQPSFATPGADHMTCKRRFYREWYAGELGNAIWNRDALDFIKLAQQDELPDNDENGGWAVRVKVPNSPHMRYELTTGAALNYLFRLYDVEKIPWELLQVSTCMPDHRLILQGELQRGTTYLNGWLRTAFDPTDPSKNRMRDSQALGFPVQGLRAVEMVKAAMDSQSWELTWEIWDRLPDATLEFGVYDIPVGVLNINTVHWEWRDY